jgi:HEPN domain-containing protein
MPPDRQAPDSPEEWLNRARSDLAIARSSIEGAYLEDLCYHAQQCVEKAFKAVLLKRRGSFPYVHDLAELVNRIDLTGLKVPEDVRYCVGLSEYAVEGRYPGFDEPVLGEQWQEAVEAASLALDWCRQVVLGTGP